MICQEKDFKIYRIHNERARLTLRTAEKLSMNQQFAGVAQLDRASVF